MLTPQQIDQISFGRATFGGYDMQDVDDFLTPLTEDYVTLYKENALLKSKMRVLVGKLEEYRKNEAAMKEAVANAQVVNISSGKQQVVLFRPTSFNDTSKAADDLKNRKAVIVNMENVDKAMARRVVDFLSGCVYALEGDVKKIAKSAYLFCPHNMNIVGDLEALQAEVESYV